MPGQPYNSNASKALVKESSKLIEHINFSNCDESQKSPWNINGTVDCPSLLAFFLLSSLISLRRNKIRKSHSWKEAPPHHKRLQSRDE
ncbi:hypothetical protein PRIPAC_80959 [Pristionchus pacificus]|uniref:Uncharacterized protein n=1 Tax=Pristionchus pacificus TaxID=54126 RepID=A0A2A6CBJ8_PRIPA|nr:hypothetical protein PRIPAC_80959 [Pristionchus pacificus]|eukprot:PDM75509.1 hypothetical protein PRIPAC_42686 [Pristionchus pacificus]